MRRQKNALHIDLRDGKLFVWGVISQTVCVYPAEISLFDPDDLPPYIVTTALPPVAPPSSPEPETPERPKRVLRFSPNEGGV